MSTTIESDLKEILTKLDQKIDKLSEDVNRKIDRLAEDVNDVKISVARLEEKVEGLSKRVESQEFTNRGVLIGLIIAIMGGAAKLFGFVGNP
jgi:uncharacterized protein YoxC